jgi:hypothetical protein
MKKLTQGTGRCDDPVIGENPNTLDFGRKKSRQRRRWEIWMTPFRREE